MKQISLENELDNINKLLRRQIRKNYSGEITPELTKLLLSINQSYEHYENDRLLLDRAMEISNIELEQANEKLRLQSKVLEDKNKTLEEFIFALAHDLKTPIRSIVSFNDIILKRHKDSLNSNVIDYLEYSVNAASQMHHLLTDLLDYASLSHKDSLGRDKVSMLELVDLAIYPLKHEVDAKGVKIDVSSNQNINVNKQQFSRVFTNLFSNAIKYQREGVSPDIKVNVEEAQRKYILSISDNGIGIPEEYHLKIFDAFSRLNPNQYSGTGIGLAICKKIVEQHQGELWLDTQYSQGAKFMLSIPKR